MFYQKINLQNIKILAHEKRITMTDLAEKIGMTYVGLSKLIRENTTTLGTITRIADALNVPVQFFFMTESELATFHDFGLEAFRDLKQEVEKLRRENSELKDKIVRLADRLP